MTVKVRNMGSNTYISVGDVNSQDFRLTSANDSKTYIAPVKNGSDQPFLVNAIWVIGDNAANDGVLECEAMI